MPAIGGGLDAGVAVAAIETEAADMMLVAERNRLVGGQGTVRSRIRRPNPIGNSDGQERCNHDRD